MGSRRIHRKSRDIDWSVHCLTFSTFHAQRFFPGKHAAGWFFESLAAAREICPFYLFAYVVMPEHVHLVLQQLPGVRIARILSRVKRPVTDRALAWARRWQPGILPRMADVQPSGRVAHRFWQRGGGYDRNLRSASDVHEKIRYVHLNPVRRGLVEHPEDWPYSSAPDWILRRKGPVPIDWDHIPAPELR